MKTRHLFMFKIRTAADINITRDVRERKKKKKSYKLIGIFNVSGYSCDLTMREHSREIKQEKKRKISRRGSVLNTKVSEQQPVRVQAINNTLLLIPHASPAIIPRKMCVCVFSSFFFSLPRLK